MRRDVSTDFARYAKLLGSVTGCSSEELVGRRSYPLPYYRAMVASSLKHDGYSTSEIGRVMKRDHSTVQYGLKQLKSALEINGFADIKVIWRSYQTEIEKHKVTKSFIEVMAEEFVGVHCKKSCALCDIAPSACRYLQDEKLFIAGATAYRERLKDVIAQFRAETAQCALLCGREDIQETLGRIESMI